MAVENYAALTAARARAEAHLATTMTQLDTARATLQSTLRGAFIAGTAVGTTADSASSDVARLLATVAQRRTCCPNWPDKSASQATTPISGDELPGSG